MITYEKMLWLKTTTLMRLINCDDCITDKFREAITKELIRRGVWSAVDKDKRL